jgi:hypothetical protein
MQCSSQFPNIEHHLTQNDSVSMSVSIGYDEYDYKRTLPEIFDSTTIRWTETKHLRDFQFCSCYSYSAYLNNHFALDFFGVLSFNPGIGLGASYLVRNRFVFNIYSQAYAANYVYDNNHKATDKILYGSQIKFKLLKYLLLGVSYDKISACDISANGNDFAMPVLSFDREFVYKYTTRFYLGFIGDENEFFQLSINSPYNDKNKLNLRLSWGQTFRDALLKNKQNEY